MNKKVIQKAKPEKMAVLGPKNTYSDLAAGKYISASGRKTKKQYFRSIAEIFTAVEKSRTTCGIVPLENIIYGSIRETYDLLLTSNVHIASKFRQGIDHVLAVLPGTKKSDIHVIASHEQALRQCQNYIRKHFPFAQKDFCSSTVTALEKMINADDRGIAVIIPAQAAKSLPIKIMAKGIQNKEKNYTAFVLIRKGPAPKKTAHAKHGLETAIAFYFRKDSPGSLYTVFRAFAGEGINLSYIESRPSVDIPGNYVFYLNFESAGSGLKSDKIIKKIRPMLAGLKILGVYPKI
jgi:chorismate mutase / prephenate dehydratase